MRRVPALVALVAIAALALAGCSSATTPDAATKPDAAASDELRTIVVGGIANVDMAAMYVGEKQGFFAEEGLDVEIEFGGGTAAMIPALLNGQYDIQFGGAPNLIQAIDAGIPVTAVTVGGRSTGVRGADHGAVVVAENSEIQSPADLEGKTVAVLALHGLHQIATWQSILNAGGDPEAVKWVEMPFPDMAAAVDSGDVDAAVTSEPFLGLALASGKREIASPFVDVAPGFVSGLYLAAVDRVETEPELYEAFSRALQKSYEYSQEHSDEIRAELGNFTEIEAGLASKMILTDFTWGLTYDDLLVVAEAAAAAGSVKDPEGAAKKAALFVDPQ